MTPTKPSAVLKRSRSFLPLALALAGCGTEIEEGDEIATVSAAVSGTTEPASGEILICEHASFGGWCDLRGTGLHHAFIPGLGDDRATSLKVGSGVRATLCRDAYYGGTCETFPPGARILNLSGYAIGNDEADSARVVRTWVPDCRFGANPPVGWLFLFRDASYGGDCVSVAAGNYPSYMSFGLANDSVSSFKIGAGVGATLCEHESGGGVCTFGIHGPASNPNMGSFNDITSSLSVYAE